LINVGDIWSYIGTVLTTAPFPRLAYKRQMRGSGTDAQRCSKEWRRTVGMITDMWTDDYKKLSYITKTFHCKDYTLVGKTLTTAMFPVEDAKIGAKYQTRDSVPAVRQIWP